VSGPRVAVVVPTFEQAAFLPRALASALDQSPTALEVVVVDDGSDDGGATTAALAPFLADPRVRALHLARNGGLGAALQAGVDATTAPLVAYLPSDDVWLSGHLASLVEALDAAPSALVAVADLVDPPPDVPAHPQLVQVLHRRTGERWLPRAVVETDDLDRMLWQRLPGERVRTGRATALWTQHPGQRSRAVRERHDGGLNVFRRRYRVAEPLRFASTDAGGAAGEVDEVALYAGLRERHLPRADDGLRVLLVGDLGFNPERVVALAERGHELHGLWTPDGLGDSGVGPVPFGHVREVRPSTAAAWRDAVARLRPDVAYTLLSWRAVPFAHEVLTGLAGSGVPVVFHLKESPQGCLRSGTWPQLAELLTRADGVVLSTEEERAWVELALPGRLHPERTLVVDGDLPLAAWHGPERSPRLSDADGEVHAVVVGRPLGLDAEVVGALAAEGVHTHVHGLVDVPAGSPVAGARQWLRHAQEAAPGRVHLHPRVAQPEWTRVLSRYDAGWLHRVRSSNGGDLRRATWDDLNAPARLGPLAAAGLPVVAARSPGCAVAVERLVGPAEAGGDGTGVLHASVEELVAALHDRAGMERRREAAWATRASRTFDAHADALVALFRRVVG
jgi:glycosyltransferase involved in cell wall biosynthesis